MVTEVMENYRNKEAGQSSLVLAKAPAVIASWLPWKKIMNLLNNNKAIKYVRSHIVNSVPNSSALKNISSFNWLNRIILKPEFVNQLESLVQKVQGFIFMFSKQCEA